MMRLANTKRVFLDYGSMMCLVEQWSSPSTMLPRLLKKRNASKNVSHTVGTDRQPGSARTYMIAGTPLDLVDLQLSRMPSCEHSQFSLFPPVGCDTFMDSVEDVTLLSLTTLPLDLSHEIQRPQTANPTDALRSDTLGAFLKRAVVSETSASLSNTA